MMLLFLNKFFFLLLLFGFYVGSISCALLLKVIKFYFESLQLL